MSAALRPAGAALLAAALVACGGAEPTYRWREGAAASMEIRVREELLPIRAAREIQVMFAGHAAAGPALEFEIRRVRQERTLDGRSRGAIVDTDTVGAVAAERDEGDAAVARVAEALLGRRVRLAFDGVGGLVRVEGMTAAIATCVPASDAAADDVAAGLRGILSDEALSRTLRGAGFVEVPSNFRDRSAPVRRTCDVFLPGRGIATCGLSGSAGFGSEGSPIAQLSGRLAADAPCRGDPGPTVPDEIGPVVIARVETEAETMYDQRSGVPLRGRLTARVPFACGASTSVTTSFALTVTE